MNALQKLLKLAGFLTSVKLASYELAEGKGTVAVNDDTMDAELKVGDAENVPIPVGEYLTTDGKTLVVTTVGKIDSIKEPEAKNDATDLSEVEQLKKTIEDMKTAQEAEKTEKTKLAEEIAKLKKQSPAGVVTTTATSETKLADEKKDKYGKMPVYLEVKNRVLAYRKFEKGK